MDTYDNTDRPAAGTECARCREHGHFCPAKGYAGETPLCEACGTGHQCSQAAAVERMQAGIGYEEFEAASAPAECRSIAIEDTERVVVEKPLEHAWTVRDQLDPANLLKGKRIAPKPAQVRAPKLVGETPIVATQPKRQEKSMAEPGQRMELEAAKAKAFELEDTHNIHQITKIVGYGWGTVSYWLKGDPKKAKREKLKGKVSGKPAAAVASDPTPPIVESVTLKAPIAALDHFWNGLSIPEKTRIVERELFGGM